MTVYEMVLNCPDMQSQADILLIREYLSLSPGVDMVECDLKTKKVRVTTAAQDGGADVRNRLSQAGFPAED
jgi:hypothetical protein